MQFNEINEQIELKDKKKKNLVCDSCGHIIALDEIVKYEVLSLTRSNDAMNIADFKVKDGNNKPVFSDYIKLYIQCKCQNCGAVKDIDVLFMVESSRYNAMSSKIQFNDYDVFDLVRKYFTTISKQTLCREWIV